MVIKKAILGNDTGDTGTGGYNLRMVWDEYKKKDRTDAIASFFIYTRL